MVKVNYRCGHAGELEERQYHLRDAQNLRRVEHYNGPVNLAGFAGRPAVDAAAWATMIPCPDCRALARMTRGLNSWLHRYLSR